jgi:hypothetical protein
MLSAHARLALSLIGCAAFCISAPSAATAKPAAHKTANKPAAPKAAKAQDLSLLDASPATADGQPAQDPAAAPDGAPPSDGPADRASASAARVIAWVTASHDNGDLPFIVIDKVAARVFVFDPSGQLLASAPALVGITKGDDSAPGVGDRELSDIPVSERTTPAGRFMARFGPAYGHKEQMLWVDLRDAISLHPVVTANPKEHRLARLASASAGDNRITFGCINVDKTFFAKVVEPLYQPAGGVVYILPEERALAEVFAGLPNDPGLAKSFDQVFAEYRLSQAETPLASAGD